MKRMILGTLALVMGIGLAAATGANAQTATSALSMNISVSPQCSITTTPVTWNGTWDGSSDVTGSGNVTVTCRNSTTPWNVAFDGGLNNLVNGHRTMGTSSGTWVGTTEMVALGNGDIEYVLTDGLGGPELGDNDFANTYPTAASKGGTGSSTFVVGGRILANPTFSGEGQYFDKVNITLHY